MTRYIPLSKSRPIAIITWTNDTLYNQNEAYIAFFYKEEDLKEWLDSANEEQPYTGLTWRVYKP